MKRITALLLIIALLLPCAATATTNRVSLVVGDMTLSLTLPGDWTQASTVADEEMISHLIVQENIVFYAQGAGKIPPVLVICAAPVAPDAKVGDRAWNAVDFSDGFIQRSYYVGTHAGYDKTTVSMGIGYRIVYSVIVNGFEYTFEFFWPVFTTESAMRPEEIIESLRFRPLTALADDHGAMNLRHHKSGQTSLTLQWETRNGAAYRVESSADGATWVTHAAALPGSGRTRTYTMQGLEPGTAYTLRVTAVENGADTLSEEVAATTEGVAPAVTATESDTVTVALPVIGITLDVPAGWFYGTPEMGTASPLVSLTGFTEDDIDQLFVQQGIHFCAIVLPEGLACQVSCVDDLPDLTMADQDALLRELHAHSAMPVEPASMGFLTCRSGTYPMLQYQVKSGFIVFLFGQGAHSNYVLSVESVTGSPIPSGLVDALMNSVRTVE